MEQVICKRRKITSGPRYFKHLKSVESSVHKLGSWDLQRLECVIKDMDYIIFHLLLYSCVSDISQAEEMLSMKRGLCNISPCHICFGWKDDVSDSTNAKVWNLKHTKDPLTNLPGESSLVDGSLELLPIHSIPPVLSQFPLFRIDPVVDIYVFFVLSKCLCCHSAYQSFLRNTCSTFFRTKEIIRK